MKTKPCRFILLSSKEKALKGDIIKVIETGKLSISAIDNNWNPKMELILISLDPDDKIEFGDIFYNDLFNMFDVLIESNVIDDNILEILNENKHNHKVIATQKQFSPKHICEFIQQYNKGEVKDVNIEMEEIEVEDYTDTTVDMYDQDVEYKPKLINGFINIINKN